MKDKDKLLLLFNVDISNVNDEEAYDYVQMVAQSFRGYFDDSVKCIFAVSKNDDKPAVQNITNFPSDGMELIENLVKFHDEKNEPALKIQIEAVKEYLKAYNDEKRKKQ